MAAKVQSIKKKPTTAKSANTSSTRKKPAPKKSASKKAVSAKRKVIAKKSAGTTTKKAIAAAPSRRGLEQPLMKALRAEHRHMATVMQLFTEQLDAIAVGELVDTHVVYEIMHYMVSWPDRFHHPREDLIYARVVEVDASLADEVDTLQRDHDQTAKRGKQVLQDIERWRQGDASGTVLVKSGREYVDHIYEHMNLEEKLVFPRIEAALTLQDWRELAEDDQLQAVSASVFGPQIQREFRNMARKLRRGVRRSVERGTLVEWIGVEAFMESLEVVSIAYESTVDTAGSHLRTAVKESLGYFRKASLSAPLHCVANNTRVTLHLLGEVAEISKETLADLARVNRERRDRIRLLDRKPARR